MPVEVGGEGGSLQEATVALQARVAEEVAKFQSENDSKEGSALVEGLRLMFGGSGSDGQAIDVWKALPLLVMELFNGDFEGLQREKDQKWCLQ